MHEIATGSLSYTAKVEHASILQTEQRDDERPSQFSLGTIPQLIMQRAQRIVKQLLPTPAGALLEGNP